MSLIFSLLMLLGVQDAPAPAPAPAPATRDAGGIHGAWKGQCWPTGLKAGPLCRIAAGRPRKLWIMIERRPNRLDIYASGACATDDSPETLPQSSIADANRVEVLRTAIELVALKINHQCGTKEAFAVDEADLAAMLTETDVVAGAAK
jgi:hypothetical protein